VEAQAAVKNICGLFGAFMIIGVKTDEEQPVEYAVNDGTIFRYTVPAQK